MESFVLGARTIRSVPEKMVLTIVFEIDGGGGSVELSSSSSTQCGIKHPSIILGITILVYTPHVTPRNTDESVL